MELADRHTLRGINGTSWLFSGIEGQSGSCADNFGCKDDQLIIAKEMIQFVE